jgi:hypothetical protein
MAFAPGDFCRRQAGDKPTPTYQKGMSPSEPWPVADSAPAPSTGRAPRLWPAPDRWPARRVALRPEGQDREGPKTLNGEGVDAGGKLYVIPTAYRSIYFQATLLEVEAVIAIGRLKKRRAASGRLGVVGQAEDALEDDVVLIFEELL